MKIKTADIFDIATVALLFDQYRVFYGKQSDVEAARNFLSERLINQQSMILLAQNEAGMALGFAQLYPSFSSVSMRKKYILNDLFPAFHRCRCEKNTSSMIYSCLSRHVSQVWVLHYWIMPRSWRVPPGRSH